MTDAQGRADVLEEVAALLGAEPGWAAHLGPGSALLVLAGDGRLLAASPAGAALLPGREDPAPLPARLRALAAGAAPRAGLRLERLRLDPSGLAPPRTCACRLVGLGSGEEVLAVVVVGAAQPHAGAAPDRGAMPAPEPRPEPLLPEPPAGPAPGSPDPDEPVPADAADAAPEPPPGPRERGPVRFLWETGADGRFVAVSPALAERVGAAQAALLGRSWDEIAGPLVHDPEGAVAGAIARGETFSARRVLWRMEGDRFGLPVTLSGSPAAPARPGAPARSRAYRGFGLCRTGEIVPHAWGPPPPPALPNPAAGPAQPDTPAPAQTATEGEPLDGWSGLFTALEGWTLALLGAPCAAARRREPRSGEAAPPPPPAAAEPPSPEIASSEPASSEAGAAEAPAVEAPAPPPSEPWPAPHLSHQEQNAFREIARTLRARFETGETASAPPADFPAEPAPASPAAPGRVEALRPAPADLPSQALRLLDRLPAGLLVHRGEEPLYANRALLDLVGHETLADLAASGGVGALFPGRSGLGVREDGAGLALRTAARESVAVDVRLTTAEWEGAPAGVMLIRRAPEADLAQRLRALELDLRARETRLRELSVILDTAADGIILLDDAGRILSLNRSAEALFGYEQNEVVGEPLGVLLAPESRRVALDYLDGLRASGVARVLNDGRTVLGRVAQGGTIPLLMVLGQVSEAPDRRFCAVLRDATAAQSVEAELAAARQASDAALRQRADFLGRNSHEVRTPLNAIIGFAELMLEERAGPLAQGPQGPQGLQGPQAPQGPQAERHADYLRDIRESGRQVVQVVDDLLDLARIEAGQMEMAFTGVSLTEAVMEAIGPLQAEAASRRVIIRTGLAPRLPPIVADARSLRQIVHNLVSNAIRFTEPGGQVIVSTALTDRREVAFRTRDTGIGMTPEEIEAALEPFRSTATARRGGSGLGLPLTKALVEANRGSLHIASSKREGTLVEVVFPPTRVLVDQG